MYIKDIYDIDICDINGKIVRMSKFRGMSVLVVNLPTDHGFNEQLEELESSYNIFKQYKFTILGFPTDQFKEEDLDEDGLSLEFEKPSKVSFPIFKPTLVNGQHAHPLFRYLSHKLPGIFGTESIKWNFTKFIIAPDGTPLKRFSPITNIHAVNEFITQIIESNHKPV